MATENTQAHLEERLNYYKTLNSIIQSFSRAEDVEQLIADAVQSVFDIFQPDRAWIVYPCDPESSFYRIPWEVTRPEYPGGGGRDSLAHQDVPIDPVSRDVIIAVLNSEKPVTFDSRSEKWTTGDPHRRFGVISQICCGVRPHIGKPWILGMHQCSHLRIWTENEQRLLSEIGQNLTHMLNQLLTLKNLQESTKLLEEAKKKAEESDRLKSAFLANVSHEIRTPLNSIIGFSNLLLEAEADALDRKKYYSIISRNGHHLMSLINDIIDLSKIEAGEVEIMVSEVNLDDLLEDLFQAFKPRADKKNLTLKKEWTSANTDTIIHSDATKLRQILINLLDNALKFTAQGEVTFGGTLQNDVLILFVRDTGIGISPQFAPHLFQRFQRERGKQADGTGLGLAITKAYVSVLGGEITYESLPGRGTRFEITLPKSLS